MNNVIAHDYSNLSNEEIEGLVRDNIDLLVPKDISYEQYIARALDISETCNSWKIGMVGTDSLEESIVIGIATELYFQ